MDAVETHSLELKQHMRSYGEKKAALETTIAAFSHDYYQAIAALIVASLVGISGMFSIFALILAVFACWRITSCFSIDERCELLDGDVDQAQEGLERCLENPAAQAQIALTFNELNGEHFQGQLATYLPGPVEIRRRPLSK